MNIAVLIILVVPMCVIESGDMKSTISDVYEDMCSFYILYMYCRNM